MSVKESTSQTRGRGIQPGDQNAAFDLVNRVALRGGYAGIGAPDPDALDRGEFLTILSGDLLGNDGPNFTNYEDNAFRVVRAANLNIETLLQGLLITSSQIDDNWILQGGGLFCSGGGLTISDCRFERNRAYRGGAVGAVEADLVIRRCTFVANWAENAGAINVAGDWPKRVVTLLIEDCEFDMNRAPTGYGGTLYALPPVNGAIRRCTISNSHSNDGAVVARHPLRFEECAFTGNWADKGGAASQGGTFLRCRFENNIAAVEGGAYESGPFPPSDQARFINCLFRNNRTNIAGGGAAFGGGAFIGCVFVENQTGVNSGGPFASGGAIKTELPALIANCVFAGNFAPGIGGALRIATGQPSTVSNCTFFSNRSNADGEAIYGPAEICNSIFGPHEGQPLSNVLTIDHSILMQPPPISGIGNIIADPRFVDPLGPDGVAGTEDDDLRLRADSPCIDAGDSTALPADQFDLDGDGDLTEPLPIDMLSNRRVLFAPPHASPPDVGVPDATGAIIDMGAHEFRRPVDCAPPTPPIGDGFVNIDDLLMVISGWGDCPKRPASCLADVNADGAVNIDDLLAVVTGWG